MATARELLKVSLRYVGEETSFSIAPDESYELALRKMNEYIESLRKNGLALNSSQAELTSLNSIVNFPSWSHTAIELNVAVMIWPMFNIEKPLPPLIYQQARDKEREMFNLYGPEIKSVYPSTLPQGIGNRDGFWGYNDVFYPQCHDNIYECDEDRINTEAGTPIVSEGQ